MTKKIQFDQAKARRYRKRVEVIAFQSADPITYRKTWGEQDVRQGGWVIVPLTESGGPTQDIYGCDAQIFADTYEPSPSLRPNRYRKKETVLAYQPHCPFEVDTQLEDGHTEVKGARTDSPDAWIVRGPKGEVYPVENEEFERTYVEVPERTDDYRTKSSHEHWKADGTPKRILALDGGGVRGILTLGYLQRIEELLRDRHGGKETFRLSHYFDLIAGTSTGAIIAAALAKGMTVSEVQTKYNSLANSIFKRSLLRRGVFRAKFSHKRIKEHLKAVFQNTTMGSSSIQTGLLVVAKRLDSGSTWPMNNNPDGPFFKATQDDDYFANEDYLLRRVVRASTAAPSYFAPELIEISPQGERPHGQFVDGGMSPHNNPALLALQLVTIDGFNAKWPLDPDKLLLISVGTGSAQPGTTASWLAGKHAVNSLLSLMDDCAESVETIMQWLSHSPTARHIDASMKDLDPDFLAERPLLQYQRYNVHLETKWLKRHLNEEFTERQVKKLKEMDRPENMEDLARLGAAAAQFQVQDSHFPANFDLGE